MANWQTIKFEFDIFDELKPPLEAALSGLQVIEALLESLLDILSPFFLDITNPLKAIIALLLAAIRIIINQIESSGFSVLLVHPNFDNQDFGAVLNSVSGAYPGFESKVIGKFFDSSDIFRPQYPQGSTVGMMVFYIGADSPGDLIGLLFDLLGLLRHPIKLQRLPAPVDLKVLPVSQSGDAVAQFRDIFSSDFTNSLTLEWRMPSGPKGGGGASGLFSQLSSLYNQFRFPNFLIERQGPFPQDSGEEEDPRGVILKKEVKATTLGPKIDSLTERYGFPKVISKVPIREESGAIYRKFSLKRALVYGGSGDAEESPIGSSSGVSSSPLALVRGIATGKYKYEDKDLIPGKTYYYRVRAFFGDATDYIGDKVDSNIIVQGTQPVVRWKGLTVGHPSNVIKGYCPPDTLSGEMLMNLYDDLVRAIEAGILLNFEMPPAYPVNNSQLASPIQGSDSTLATEQEGSFLLFPDNTQFRNEQRTGWGVLGGISQQIALLKAYVDDSEELRNNFIFKATCRRLANSVIDTINSNTALLQLISTKWPNVESIIRSIETDSAGGRTWGFVGIIGGITSNSANVIDEYLSKEDSYSGGNPIDGPLPIVESGSSPSLNKRPSAIDIQSRAELAEFLRICLSVDFANNGYMSWYSITVGDLFPDLNVFLFDLEQYIKALLNALNSALEEIKDIVKNLIQQIQTLEQIIVTILQILDILSITVSVSVLTTVTTNGSSGSLAQSLLSSGDKPGDSPFGLHSGLVFTFGGPGEGSLAAFNAIRYILGF